MIKGADANLLLQPSHPDFCTRPPPHPPAYPTTLFLCLDTHLAIAWWLGNSLFQFVQRTPSSSIAGAVLDLHLERWTNACQHVPSSSTSTQWHDRQPYFRVIKASSPIKHQRWVILAIVWMQFPLLIKSLLFFLLFYISF